MTRVRPEDCPKWPDCSAPICPLDYEWEKRIHRKDDPVCIWFREYAKAGGRAFLKGVIARKILERVAEVYSQAKSRHAPLRKSLERASRTGSKLAVSPRKTAARAKESRQSLKGPQLEVAREDEVDG